MLHWLRARNVALLQEAFLEFGDGLNVVSGETGVGKSLLLESLALALGGRGRAQLVGPAADRAVVEAGFACDDDDGAGTDLQRLCDNHAVPVEDGELVVRRELRAGAGRRSVSNRVTANGVPIPVAALRRFGRALAEVYGQGEYLALLEPGAARETVDAVGGHDAARRVLAAAFREVRTAEAARDALDARLREASVRREEMERAAGEIERAAPEPGELESLAAERGALVHAEELSERLETAYQALHGAETAASAQVAAAFRALDAAAGLDPETGRLLEGRPDLLVEVEDLAAAVRDRQESVRAAPARLAAIEDRLALLRGLERRHCGGAGGTEALLERLRELRAALGLLDDQTAERQRTTAAAAETAGRYRELAAALRAARESAAERLSSRVERELKGLGIPRARFEIGFEPLTPKPVSKHSASPADERSSAEATAHFTEHGLDRVRFLFSASPEVPPAPIADVASGGESSRFFLALKAAAAEEDGAGEGLQAEGGPATLVFDEADTGTSGRIADAVGRRLRRLAASRQVLSVTHLPQVAALGRTHLAVEKLESGDAIRVRCLEGEARIEEIARMLAGPEITASARDHARELLASAGGEAFGADPTEAATARSAPSQTSDPTDDLKSVSGSLRG